jgi:hypothetical protein
MKRGRDQIKGEVDSMEMLKGSVRAFSFNKIIG